MDEFILNALALADACWLPLLLVGCSLLIAWSGGRVVRQQIHRARLAGELRQIRGAAYRERPR